MAGENESNNTSSKKYFNSLNKFSQFIDVVIFLASIWISIALVLYFNDSIPNWKGKADRIILCVFAFLLVYITLSTFRPVLLLALLISIGYFSWTIIQQYQDTKKMPNTYQNFEIKLQQVINAIDPRIEEQQKQIDKLIQKNSLLEGKLNVMAKQINRDSLKIKNLELQFDSLLHKKPNKSYK